MAYTKQQVMNLRNSAQKLLDRFESDEKNSYKQLATSWDGSKVKLDQIIAKLDNNKEFEKITLTLKNLKSELGQAISGVSIDLNPVINALSSLNQSVKGKADYSDLGILKALSTIEKKLESQKSPKDRTGEVIKAIKAIKVKAPSIDFPDKISVDNFPPQLTPQPVTNININPLRGFVHTTATTVTSTLTTLPGYGVLDNRRSLVVYNNSSNTIYIGGSGVTVANGLPVPASSYSTIIDAGIKMIVYGIASTGSNNVRVMEISNDEIGG